MKYYKYYLVALLVIAIDQLSKFWVYHNMILGPAGEIDVLGDWFKLHYLLNPGMAFGMRLDWEWGKLLLTVFRLVATFGIGYWVMALAEKKVHAGLIFCLALVLGGAMGNLVDSIFYGVWLGNAVPGAPTPWFHGQVIDMLYFPLYEGYLPDWIPVYGGEYFIFFRPVFNIADSAIFVGIVTAFIFQKRFFSQEQQAAEPMQEEKLVS